MGVSTSSGVLCLSNHRNGHTVTVTITGELDVATADRLLRHVDRTLRGDVTGVVLDMTEVSFIAAAGLGVLVALAESAAEHDTMLRLGDVSPMVARLLDITGLTQRFPVERAVAGLRDMGSGPG
ncbi:STAS domain-containing protein [Spirillospora sp. NPDC048911]|uniref:STAS domain-containing protein n=1 Tax=Spirillospora sp. NPDC048911 TaxID=3364527 RepID=UPI003722700D